VMRSQAEGLNEEQIASVALYLTQKDLGSSRAPGPESNPCAHPGKPRAADSSSWNGWGRDLENSRYQPQPGFSAADVGHLKLKWAYAYHGTITYGQPTVVADRLYATSSTGRVYALDARTGCTYWTHDAGRAVRTAVSVAPAGKAHPLAVFFGDDSGSVHALDATDGHEIWSRVVDAHPSARVTGAPVWYRGRLYVPLSSSEEGVGRAANYSCCTFRGSVVALDASSGDIVWKSFNIPDEPKPYRKNDAGTQLYGPAGGSTWAAPTIDTRRGTIYVGTGNSYTSVNTSTTDAVLALDLATGAHRWQYQALTHDNYLVLCMQAGVANCPLPLGPDLDFGSSLIVRRLPHGKTVILAGQKSGIVWAFDADAGGKVLWQTRVGRGGAGGGVAWGMAADDTQVYAAVSDQTMAPSTDSEGGLTALSIATGARIWSTPAPAPKCSWGPPANCSAAQTAVISVVPGLVFSGSVDGHLRAYSTRDGAIVWDFDTAKSYDTVNGLPGAGGSLDGGGPVVANGMLFVNSGYGKFNGQAGNVLLAFEIERH